MSEIELDEIKEMWAKEVKDNLLKAATEDLNNYPEEVQRVIIEEAHKRGLETYKVYYHRTGGYRAVKQGFYWLAFWFPFFWAFAMKLWLQGIIGFIVIEVLDSFYWTFREQNDFGHGIVAFLLILTNSIIFGAFGKRWRTKSLVKRGFEYKDTVTAMDTEDAIIQVADRNEEGEKGDSD